MSDIVSLDDYRDGDKRLKSGHLDAVKDGLKARGTKARRAVSFDRSEFGRLLQRRVEGAWYQGAQGGVF